MSILRCFLTYLKCSFKKKTTASADNSAKTVVFNVRRKSYLSDGLFAVVFPKKSAPTAAVVVVAAAAVVTPVTVAAAAEQDNDKDNDPTAVTSAKTKSAIVHIRTLLLIMYLKPLGRCFRRCFILHYMAAAEKCYCYLRKSCLFGGSGQELSEKPDIKVCSVSL